jgi:hypothetical protein
MAEPKPGGMMSFRLTVAAPGFFSEAVAEVVLAARRSSNQPGEALIRCESLLDEPNSAESKSVSVEVK